MPRKTKVEVLTIGALRIAKKAVAGKYNDSLSLDAYHVAGRLAAVILEKALANMSGHEAIKEITMEGGGE